MADRERPDWFDYVIPADEDTAAESAAMDGEGAGATTTRPAVS